MSVSVQILESSDTDRTSVMFGAAISKGVDIDGNEYNDISVGAPLTDTVYVFKTYPIVRPIVNMTTSKQILFIKEEVDHAEPTDVVSDDCDVAICYHLEINNQNTSYGNVDPHFSRV